jgi:hemerythrin
VEPGAGFIVERLRESKQYKTSPKEADTVHVSLIKPLQKTKPETNIKQSIQKSILKTGFLKTPTNHFGEEVVL